MIEHLLEIMEQAGYALSLFSVAVIIGSFLISAWRYLRQYREINLATTNPGALDETQLQHYEMLRSAITAESKSDALSTLELMKSDASRWRLNMLTREQVLVDFKHISDAVEKGDWALANQLSLDLHARHGHPQ